MTLGFSRKFPWGEPTGFKTKILAYWEGNRSNCKFHSIRQDPHKRWKAGRLIHMAYGVRTKNYHCFKQTKCISTQEIVIKYPKVAAHEGSGYPEIYIDGKYCNLIWREKLAKNDGFDSLNDFYRWFSQDYKGVIIHWTDLRY